MDATEENFAAREDVDKDIDIIKVLVDKKDQFTRRSVVDGVLEKFETNFYALTSSSSKSTKLTSSASSTSSSSLVSSNMSLDSSLPSPPTDSSLVSIS